MKHLKWAWPLAAALLASACVSIDSVSIPTGGAKGPGGSVRYQCENGYRVSVTYKNADEIGITFNNGKDTFVTTARSAPAASGAYYVNDLNNLRWHVKNDSAVFNYPASDWRTSGRVLETVCSER